MAAYGEIPMAAVNRCHLIDTSRPINKNRTEPSTEAGDYAKSITEPIRETRHPSALRSPNFR